jgi:ELWxxDGT repeat protein
MKKYLFAIIILNATNQFLSAQVLSTIDIAPSGYGATPSDFTILNNKLYMLADDGISGKELWVTDGSQANTKLAIDYIPGANGSQLLKLKTLKNKIYCRTYDYLNSSNGLISTEGTLGTIEVLSNKQDVREPIEFNNEVYFLEGIYTATFSGVILKKTNGTTIGTIDVDTIFTNYAAVPILGGTSMAVLNKKLYFSITPNYKPEKELFVNDPIVNNATYADLSSDYIVNADRLYTYQNKLYFSAELNSKTIGFELFSLDTFGTIVLAADFTPGAGSSYIHLLHGVGNVLFFTADEPGYGYQLFSINHNSTGITSYPILHNALANGYINNKFNYKGNMYFSAVSDTSISLYRYNTNSNTIELIKNTLKFTTNLDCGYLRTFFEYNDLLYFYASDTAIYVNAFTNDADMQLWQSDGTTAGTKKVNLGVPPKLKALNYYNEAIVYNGSAYFTGEYNSIGQELQKFSVYLATLNNLKPEVQIHIYPNPFNSEITIDNKEKEAAKVAIINMTGCVIATYDVLHGENKIALSTLVSGHYIMQITNNTNQIIKNYTITKQ